MNELGNLVIPNHADPKFQWWLESTDEQPRLTLDEVLTAAGATDEQRARIAGAPVVDEPEANSLPMFQPRIPRRGRK